ncbi:Mbeg1-like protein [Lachnospiraceae bacterium 54-53]
MNIIDYAESQMENFKAKKFNLVDSLVLSQFVYIHFNDVVPGLSDNQEPVRIGELLKAEHIPHMLHNVRDPKSNHRLLLALGMSPRFRDIRMCCFSDSLNIAEQKQFAAVTYLIDDETAYVAYRGTDSSIVGWKEDFNMAFISPVPAQQEGVSYLNAVAERFAHMLMVGGHSKGGNIAVYSSMGCHPTIQDRIVSIYSHDGPGFRNEIFTSEKYARIKSKCFKRWRTIQFTLFMLS